MIIATLMRNPLFDSAQMSKAVIRKLSSGMK
jgi:hypothetical protein